MRKMILCISIVSCLASSVAFGQGRPGGAGPPSGNPGGPPMGNPGGSSMGNPSMGGGIRGEFGSAHSDARSLEAQQRSTLRREEARALRDAKAPEKALFGLSTAERAQLLKDADLATRKAFGTYQAALAKAKRPEGSTALASEARMTAADLQTFGADTQSRARELKGSDRTTKQAFGTFQASLARQQALERAAGATSANAQFGMETSEGAKLQGKVDADSRKAFGDKTATRAKANKQQ